MQLPSELKSMWSKIGLNQEMAVSIHVCHTLMSSIDRRDHLSADDT